MINPSCMSIYLWPCQGNELTQSSSGNIPRTLLSTTSTK
jgi:hypothetical protein